MITIENIISPCIIPITLYAISTTIAIIIISIRSTKRKNRYADWKKDTLNLGVFVREWERNDDMFIEELFSENKKLSLENKALSKNLTLVSMAVLIWFIFSNFEKLLKNSFKKR
jgi:uncharacterized membrane protein YbaN (DUF454 family)